MIFDLPWPPSVNNYYATFKGRRIISREGRAYRGTVAAIVGRVNPLLGRLAVTIEATPPDRRRRDLDNICKSTLDALGKAGVYGDDSQIDSLKVLRRPVGAGGISVTIEDIPPGFLEREGRGT